MTMNYDGYIGFKTMNYNAMLADLEPKWREIFVRAQTYANLNGIDRDFANERLGELFDMLVTAQSEDKPVNRITGGNPERFCKEIFSDYDLKERFKAFPKKLFYTAFLVLDFALIILVGKCRGFSDIPEQTIPMSGFLIGFALSIVFELINIVFITPRMLKSHNIAWWKRISMLISAAVILAFVYANFKYNFVDPLETPAWIVAVITGTISLVYLLVRSIWRYKNYGTVRNERVRLEREAYERSANDGFAEEKILREWSAKYKTLSQNGEVTEQSFIEIAKQDIERKRKHNYLYYLLFAVLYGAFFIGNTFDPDQTADAITLLLSAVAMGFIYYCIFLMTAKKAFITNDNRKRLIAECEKSGETLPAFVVRKMGLKEKCTS